MSITTSSAFINFTNGTPRAEKIIATSNVGVGTSAPAYNLDVSGDINFTGTLYENGVAFSSGIDTTQTLALTNATTGLTVSSNANVTGNVTAGTFIGDGSQLTGVGIDTTQTLTLTNATTGLTVSSNAIVTGNVTAESFIGNTLTLNTVAVTSTLGLDEVLNNGNTSSNTIQITNSTESVSNTTGAIVVSGGVGVGSNLFVGKDLTVSGTVTLNAVSLSTTTNFQEVTNDGNTTTNTVEFNNPTTSLVATSNVGIGTGSPRAPLDINDTGAIIIPVGTTAQRPSNGVTGMFRINTDYNSLEYFYNTMWLSSINNGLDETTAASSASHIANVLGSNVQDGLYWLRLDGMVNAEQFYIYFNREFASEGLHNYVVLSTFGRDSGGIFTTSNWTSTGTVSTGLNTVYSRMYLLQNIFPTQSDGKYYTWLQNKLEITGNPWIEWVSAQTANPYNSKSSSVDVAGKQEIYRTSGISSWGGFGGYHNQSSSYPNAGGYIVGSIVPGHWFFNAGGFITYWGDNIPTAAVSYPGNVAVTYTYNGTSYDLTVNTSESRHNIFAVAN